MKVARASIITVLYFCWFLMMAGVVLFLSSFAFSSLKGMLAGVLFIFLSNLIYSILDARKRFSYIVYLIAFFVFLLGRLFFSIFDDDNFLSFSNEINTHILFALFLSLLFLQVGYLIGEGLERRTAFVLKPNKCLYNQFVSWVSLKIFIVSSICFTVCNIEEYLFILSNSYVESYYLFKSTIPRFFHIIGNMRTISMLCFLSAIPEKKKCLLPIVIFAVTSLSMLMTGSRGQFILDVAIILVYIFWREFESGEVWISRRTIVIGICLLPLVFAGLHAFVYVREGLEVGKTTLWNEFVTFFKATGKSVNIIGYAKEYVKEFSQSGYSIGEIIDYLMYNPITELFFGWSRPQPYTAEYASQMHAYSHAITYLIEPSEYLTGRGLGSSYIAELYQDMGYFGIALGNIAYGLLLSAPFWLNKIAPLRLAILFCSLRTIFFSPRASACGPLSAVFNITSLGTVIVIYVIAKLLLAKAEVLNPIPLYSLQRVCVNKEYPICEIDPCNSFEW